MSLGLGLWPAKPETLGNAGMSTFPKLGMSSVGKSTELAAAALWDLGLDLLGLYEGRDSLSACAHGLGVVGLHLLQTLVVLLGKAHIPPELGIHPLKRFIFLQLGFFDVISVPFSGQMCFLDLAMSALKPVIPKAPETGREAPLGSF